MKRLSNRWHLMSSFSGTRINRPFGASSNNVEGSIMNPNSEINTDQKYWEMTGKVAGSYTLPADVLVSGSFESRNGARFTRQVLVRGGVTIPSQVVNADPFGSIQLPTINVTNFRVEKIFALPNAQRTTVRVDIYNAFNGNTITNIQPRAGAQFMRPRAIMAPRIAEFSVTYAF